MSVPAAVPSRITPSRWGTDSLFVRKALKFIKTKGAVTAEQLVEWDATHGRRLFTWDNADAADSYRIHEARLFLNSFRAKFDGMRVRAFTHVQEDETAGIEKSAYYTVETISKHPGMRAQVVSDITRRMAMLASELKMWKLSDTEREALFERLRKELEG